MVKATPKASVAWAISNRGEVKLRLRDGQSIGFQTLKSFVAFPALSGVLGHGRTCPQAEGLLVRVRYVRSWSGLLWVSGEAPYAQVDRVYFNDMPFSIGAFSVLLSAAGVTSLSSPRSGTSKHSTRA